MPDDVTTELGRMLTAGATVAAVAVPVGLAALALSWGRSRSLLPGWKPRRVPWGGFEVVVAFLVLSVVAPELTMRGLTESGFFTRVYGSDSPTALLPLETGAAVAGVPAAVAAREAAQIAVAVRRLWAGVVALPVQLALVFVFLRAAYPKWRPPSQPGASEGVTLGVAAWLVLAPLVLLFNVGVNYLYTLLDGQPDEHPLARLGGRPWLDSVLFLAQACVAAPVIEELVFRGLLLPWLLGGRKPQPAPDVPTPLRPWLAVAAAVGFAALTGRVGPLLFAVGLGIGLVILLGLVRSKRRTVGAVYASAAVFAMVHAAIWPSPVPLFLFGLGLGWLAVRTRGILAPVIVHGLFNAISAVYVLRGGAG